MKICFLADASSIHTRRWIKALVDRGHHIFLVSYQLWPDPMEQVEFHPLPSLPAGYQMQGKHSRIRGYVHRICTVLHLRKLFARIRPELIHAHYISGYGHLALLAGWRPYLLTAWGSDLYLYSSSSFFNRLQTRLALKFSALVTADSQDLLSLARSLGAPTSKLRLVQFGVDRHVFFPIQDRESLRSKWGIGPQDQVIFSPRSLSQQYNIDIIVESFASLKHIFPQAKLILKDSPSDLTYRAKIQGLIADLKIQDSVKWVATIPTSEMAELYNLADVVVSLAKTDGTPVSLLEALACEAVVVASDLPSIREWIEEGRNGFLVDPNDAEKAAVKLLNALRLEEHQREEFASFNRGIIRARGDHTKNMDQMEGLYQRLILDKMKQHSPSQTQP